MAPTQSAASWSSCAHLKSAKATVDLYLCAELRAWWTVDDRCAHGTHVRSGAHHNLSTPAQMVWVSISGARVRACAVGPKDLRVCVCARMRVSSCANLCVDRKSVV